VLHLLRPGRFRVSANSRPGGPRPDRAPRRPHRSRPVDGRRGDGPGVGLRAVRSAAPAGDSLKRWVHAGAGGRPARPGGSPNRSSAPRPSPHHGPAPFGRVAPSSAVSNPFPTGQSDQLRTREGLSRPAHLRSDGRERRDGRRLRPGRRRGRGGQSPQEDDPAQDGSAHGGSPRVVGSRSGRRQGRSTGRGGGATGTGGSFASRAFHRGSSRAASVRAALAPGRSPVSWRRCPSRAYALGSCVRASL
jgi:hypothetical protein